MQIRTFKRVLLGGPQSIYQLCNHAEVARVPRGAYSKQEELWQNRFRAVILVKEIQLK